MSEFRTEQDSMGDLQVPADALWGAQTQRAVNNFPISGQPMPAAFIPTLGLVKSACAQATRELGLLDDEKADAIVAAAARVAGNEVDAHFPIDIYQTGSGTSTNMNANEVIAHLAERNGTPAVHPNEHVNMSQSSNDVIPTTLNASPCLATPETLLAAMAHLRETLEDRAGT